MSEGAGGASQFAELLEQLAYEHEREVSLLQAEIAWLTCHNRDSSRDIDVASISSMPTAAQRMLEKQKTVQDIAFTLQLENRQTATRVNLAKASLTKGDSALRIPDSLTSHSLDASPEFGVNLSQVTPLVALLDMDMQEEAAQERTPIPAHGQCAQTSLQQEAGKLQILEDSSPSTAEARPSQTLDYGQVLSTGGQMSSFYSMGADNGPNISQIFSAERTLASMEEPLEKSTRSSLCSSAGSSSMATDANMWKRAPQTPLGMWQKLISVVKHTDCHLVKLESRWHAVIEDLEDPCKYGKHFGIHTKIQGRSAKSFLVDAILDSAKGKSDRPLWSSPTRSMLIEKMGLLKNIVLFAKVFCVLHPNSRIRMVWDVAGMLLLFHDLVVIPLQAFANGTSGFSADYVDFITQYDLFVTLFWTFDVLVSFMTGYYSDQGFVEISHRKIAKNYMKTWFPLDLIIVAVDWISFALNLKSEVGYLRLGKTVSRTMRILRLLRFMKLSENFEKMMQRINSEYILTLVGVLKLLMGMVFANHYIACGWYAVSRVGMEPAWSRQFLSEREDMAYAYLSSLHWSLTQFTPASMEVHPTNNLERLYTILVIIGAMVVFSSFVSSITGAMTHLRTINSKKAEQDASIRLYFSMHNISQELASQVWHFRRHNTMATKSRVKESDLPALKYLPERVRERLRMEVYSPILRMHPLFALYLDVCPEGMMQICNETTSERQLLAGQELVQNNEGIDKMIFVCYGVVEYHSDEFNRFRDGQGEHKVSATSGATAGSRKTARQKISRYTSRAKSKAATKTPNRGSWLLQRNSSSSQLGNALNQELCVHKGSWACEIALWSRHGRLFGPFVAGDSGSEIIFIDAEKFQDVILRNTEGLDLVVKYAEVFVRAFNRAHQNPLTGALFNDRQTMHELMEMLCEDLPDKPDPKHENDEGSVWQFITRPLNRTSRRATYA